MGQKFKRVIPAIFVMVCAMDWVTVLPLPAEAQGAPVSLQEQLSAQYKPVKMGSDSSGPSVITPGTVLAIQKGGILLSVHCDTSDEIKRAKEVMKNTGGEDISSTSESSSKSLEEEGLAAFLLKSRMGFRNLNELRK